MNVIEFPKSKIVRDVPVPIEEVEKAKEKGKQNYADSILAEVISGLAGELENYGIEVEDETGKLISKDFIFLTDVLKCVIYRNMGLEHPLHKFVDENVATFTDEKEYLAYLESMKELDLLDDLTDEENDTQ